MPSRLYNRSFANNEISSEISKRRNENIYIEHKPAETNTKELQRISVDKFDRESKNDWIKYNNVAGASILIQVSIYA